MGFDDFVIQLKLIGLKEIELKRGRYILEDNAYSVDLNNRTVYDVKVIDEPKLLTDLEAVFLDIQKNSDYHLWFNEFALQHLSIIEDYRVPGKEKQ